MQVTAMIKFIKYLPLVSLLSFIVFLLVIRVTYGYWPYYGHPDAGNFKGFFLYLDIFVFCLVLMAIFSLPIELFFHYKNRVQNSPQKIYYIAYLSLILFIYFDFWGFVDWFLD